MKNTSSTSAFETLRKQYLAAVAQRASYIALRDLAATLPGVAYEVERLNLAVLEAEADADSILAEMSPQEIGQLAENGDPAPTW